MHIISMLLLPVLFLLSGVLCGASAVESVPTYERQDPLTGETLICDKCPPGTHMAAHCTATMPTKCAPCKDDHFTELWNYLPRCLYCSNFCFENHEVEKECSAVNNRVCRCKEGFYSTLDICKRLSACGPGHGVQTKGTSQMDTVCEKCDDGYFSNSTSALDSCVSHQECANGQTVLLPGSTYRDTVCGTCEDLADGGETSRAFMSGLFNMHRTRLSKLKKFVARYIHNSRPALPTQKGPLLDLIVAWLAGNPEEHLKKLPEMLRATQFCSTAEKLETRLKEIKQTPNCKFASHICSVKD